MDLHVLANTAVDWVTNSNNINWLLGGLLGLSEWMGTSSVFKIKSLSGVVVKVYKAIQTIEMLEKAEEAKSITTAVPKT